MKSCISILFLFLVSLSVSTLAQNSSADQLLEKYSYKMKIGDRFTVVSNYEVYYKAKKVKPGAITDIEIDTLKQGTMFTLTDATIDTEKDFVTGKKIEKTNLVIKTDDGRIRKIFHPEYLHTRCYKEGESPIPATKFAALEYSLSWKESSFWTTFLIAIIISLVYIYQMKRIDRILYKLTKREQKIFSPGKSFFFISGLVGAVTGVILFISADLFEMFYMYAPVFTYPSGESWIVKYYWAIQFLFIPFFIWAVYRNILEFGPAFGLVRSVILFIAGVAFFWSGVAIALIAIGLIVLMIMGSMAKTIGESTPKAEFQRGFRGTCSKCGGLNGIHNGGCPYFHNNMYRDDPAYSDTHPKNKK